jgi:hypothetical protein
MPQDRGKGSARIAQRENKVSNLNSKGRSRFTRFPDSIARGEYCRSRFGRPFFEQVVARHERQVLRLDLAKTLIPRRRIRNVGRNDLKVV